MQVEPTFPPQGVFRQPDGSVTWRLWAPRCQSISLVTWPGGRETVSPMRARPYGYFDYRGFGVSEGLRYCYRLENGKDRPDPASRWQPDGVHEPSAVFFAEDYAWTDRGWHGVPREDLVLYELHVGTFTSEGTFDAVIPRLGTLRDLGVTAIEIMPVAQFPGERNWGYDGVHPYAVQNTYGGPHGLQRLVNACHNAGIGVFLDVVYNHVGPEGNYLGEFGPCFTDRYHTPWGAAINFDGADCEPVRRFVIDNACQWVTDFHVDGLRLDAVQMIFDFSAAHILAELQAAVQQVAAEQGRIVHVIAETDQNDARLIREPAAGGHGLDGVWCDDFHHSIHALLSGERDGYYADFGDAGHLAKAFNDAFVYDGCYSRFRRRRVGSPVTGMDRSRFVVCLKNHDQIGNRARGDRPATYLSPAQQRLSCGLLLLSPSVPLIFMGEEYAEERPFPFFCSFLDPDLIEAVRQGRRREFEELNFVWGDDIPDPQSPDTFAAARLSWSWPDGTHHAHLRQLHQDLLRARRQWPALRDRRHTRARLGRDATESTERPASSLLIIERGMNPGIVAYANLGDHSRSLEDEFADRQDRIFSTEDARYGGAREAEVAGGVLLPYELLIFGRGEVPA